MWVFLISFANRFSNKILFYDGLVLALNNSFLLQLLQIWYLCIFSNSQWFFQELHYSSTSNKYFSKPFCAFFLYSVFVSICGFSQKFWSNRMTLWTFFKASPWFNACFNLHSTKGFSYTSLIKGVNMYPMYFYTFLSTKGRIFDQKWLLVLCTPSCNFFISFCVIVSLNTAIYERWTVR